MNSDRPATIRIAVVGHTNAGKTSLLRTLTRDQNFGEVSIHPATTRQVEAVRLDLGDGRLIEFDDTPGFEDSVGLLDTLHRGDPDPRTPGPLRLERFLVTPAAVTEFAQEAKALRQLLASDLAIYVVDASEPVSGRYADECVILAWSGKPCLVVLNFIARATAISAWRDALRQAGLHNVVEFDTVVFDPDEERRLLRQLAVLLPAAEAHLDRLLELRRAERAGQLDAAAALIADTLAGCAALRTSGSDATDLRDQARRREQALHADLLALFRFSERDQAPAEVPIAGSAWSVDLFDSRILTQLGLGLGSAAAKGAATGAAIDLVTGFTSLGTATMAGGVIGALLDTANRVRRYFGSRDQDRQATQVDAVTLRFLARRACVLTRHLANRGHAAMQPIAVNWSESLHDEERLIMLLERARTLPAWVRTSRQGDRLRPALIEIVRTNLPD
ncbi:MAG: DUF3482 domain-containing protein [Gammaproteobacteria bacterium]|nr:DUF3482 domain-containing protein [Gammaproteobacteria bacterium]